MAIDTPGPTPDELKTPDTSKESTPAPGPGSPDRPMQPRITKEAKEAKEAKDAKDAKEAGAKAHDRANKIYKDKATIIGKTTATISTGVVAGGKAAGKFAFFKAFDVLDAIDGATEKWIPSILKNPIKSFEKTLALSSILTSSERLKDTRIPSTSKSSSAAIPLMSQLSRKVTRWQSPRFQKEKVFKVS